MSLRAFHLLFIALSVALSLLFAAWALGQYRMEAGLGYAASALVAMAAAAGLAVYGAAFRRKTRSF